MKTSRLSRLLRRVDARFLNGRLFYSGLVRKGIVRYDKTSRTYVRETAYGRFYLDPRDLGLCRVLAVNGTREDESVRLMAEVLTPEMHVMEIGANIGFYVVIEGKILRRGKGRITAVEPFPANVRMLRLNVEGNGLSERVSVHECALSGATGPVDFALSDKHNLHKLASLAPRHTYRRAIQVQAYTLQDFAKRTGVDLLSVDFIRMDVEGAEYSILPQWLDIIRERERFAMFVEFHASLNPEGHRSTVASLESAGFSCRAATKETMQDGRLLRRHMKRLPMRALYEDPSLLMDGGCEVFLQKGVN